MREAAVENNALVYGVFDNVDVRSETASTILTTEFTQVNFTVEHEFTDTVRGKFYIGRAKSEFANPVQTTVTLDRQNIQGYSFDFRDNPNTPVINYGFDVANPANWHGATSAWARPWRPCRVRKSGCVRTAWTPPSKPCRATSNGTSDDWLTLKAGLNGKTYLSDSYEFRRTDETVVPALPAGDDGGQHLERADRLRRQPDPRRARRTSWVRPDLNALASLFNIYCNCNTGVLGGDFSLTSITNGNARGGNRTIEENDFAYYVQADFNTDCSDIPVRGNVGVRKAYTELIAEGYSSTGGGTRVRGENKYDDTLPSLNLAIEPMEDLIVRFGAAKVMARPQIGNTLAGTNYLVPTTSLSTTGPNFTASIGNVNLEPFRAKTYDLSVEWYFAAGKPAVLRLLLQGHRHLHSDHPSGPAVYGPDRPEPVGLRSGAVHRRLLGLDGLPADLAR